MFIRCAYVLASMAFILCFGAAHAQSRVFLSGVVDSGVDRSKQGDIRQSRLLGSGSIGSRISFRGSEDLGDGLSAIFALEMGLLTDTGNLAIGGRGFGRESVVGLKSERFGTLLAGRTYTPYNWQSLSIDAFVGMGSGGLLTLTRSGAVTTEPMPILGPTGRVDNALLYVSPLFSGFELRAIKALGEGDAQIGAAQGFSVRYNGERLVAIVAWNQQLGSANKADSGKIDSKMLGGSYDFGPVRVFAGLTDEKNTCSSCLALLARAPGVAGTRASEFRLANLGVRVPIGATTLIAQVVRVNDRSDYTVNPGSRNATWEAIGAEYAFSRRTVLYSSLGTIDNQNGSQYALGSGGDQRPAASVPSGNPRSSTLTLGVRHFF